MNMPLQISKAAATSADARHGSQAPALPKNIEESGLPFQFVAELVAKIFHYTGPQRLAELADRIKLPAGVLEPVVDFLRRERLCEIASTSTGTSRILTLTDLGRERAEQYLKVCRYAGPAPVSLESYVNQVRRQAIVGLPVTRDDVRRAFSGVMIGGEVLDQVGAAMNSGSAIFLYGSAGSGKTYIAEKLARLFIDDVFVPYAILVRNQVIQVFDPHSHEAAPQIRPDVPSLVRAKAGDARWVQCRRPAVITGGELTLGMLDLQCDPETRFYAAPPQLKANNGIFIIDDLGRQLVTAQDLMNRWIVPLDRHVDYLKLHTGEKFMVPFDVTVIFCTNLSPVQLADEAFLRRLGYKIHIGALSEVDYRAVCSQVCKALDIQENRAAIDQLVARMNAERRPLNACTPRDLLRQVRDQARYQGVPAELSGEWLDWAWHNYFVVGTQAFTDH